MQPHSQTYGTGGGPGGIAFSDSAPGGFRFLSPCRKEQRMDIKYPGNVFSPGIGFDAQRSPQQGSPPAVFLAHLSPFVL